MFSLDKQLTDSIQRSISLKLKIILINLQLVVCSSEDYRSSTEVSPKFKFNSSFWFVMEEHVTIVDATVTAMALSNASKTVVGIPAGNTQEGLHTLFSRESVIIKFCFMMIILVIGISGNSFLIYVILKSPQLLQHKTNVLVCNLIATDLLSTITVCIFVAGYQLGIYVFSKNPCQFIPLVAASFPIFRVSVTAEKVCLIFITIDRYIAIVYPLEYETKFTDMLARRLVVVPWLIGLAASFAYAMYLLKVDFSSCAPPYSMIMNSFFDTGTYAAVVCVMIVTYGKILTVVKEQRLKIADSNLQTTDSERLSRELKAVLVFAVVLGTYIIFWFPYQVGRFMQSMGNTQPYTQITVDIGTSLGSINYAVDWIIYGVSSKAFRRAIVNILYQRK